MMQQPVQQPIQQFTAPQPQSGYTTVAVPVQATYPVKYEHFSSRLAIWLGSILIALGVIMIILNGVLIGLGSIFGFISQGILSGIFFVLTGAFSISSGKFKSKCPIITMLVLAIIGAVAAIPALAMHVMGGIGLDYYDYYNKTTQDINITIAFMAGICGIICIVCSVLGCSAFCSGRNYQQTAMITIPMNVVGNTGPAQYIYQSGQQQPLPTQPVMLPPVQAQPAEEQQIAEGGLPPPYTEKMSGNPQ